MEKEAVKRFFDDKANVWDSMDETQPDIVNTILDNAQIKSDLRLLDVACGTGVLIPFYLERGIKDITAIDLSPEMINRAKEKFSDTGVKFITGDVEDKANVICGDDDKKFDRIVMYNAFPHFIDPGRIVRTLCDLLAPGGILTIAHGKSREVIDAHHKGEAAHISRGLMPIEALAALFPENAKEIVRVSDDKMYQIAVRG